MMLPKRISELRDDYAEWCKDSTRAECLDEIERLQKLAEFGGFMLAEVKECITEGGIDIDGEVIADKAVECGLMQYVPYDPAVHDSMAGGFDGEPGDMIYYWGPTNEA